MPFLGVNTTRVGPRKSGGAAPNPNFISTWDTTQTGSASDTIVLPMTAGNTVDWGDGNIDTTNTHTYAAGGTYTVTISGTINTFRFANSGDRRKITDVSNWGTFEIANTQTFHGCSNLNLTATDAPTLSTAILDYTFYQCTAFNSDINHWDVSNATSLGGFFAICPNFNQPLNNWDVSNVTSFRTSFYSMFRDCFAFNQDLGSWDVSSTTSLRALFLRCTSFNNGGSDSIKDWNVSGISDFTEVFENCYVFNQPLANWDVSSATSLNSMFKTCRVFDQPIDNWDVSNVTNSAEIFSGCLVFNQPLNSWVTTKFNNCLGTFANCALFNQNIGSWDVSSVTDMTAMFQGATLFNNGGSGDIDNWDTSNVTRFGFSFSGMFRYAYAFNQYIGSWDLSSCDRMDAMFESTNYNQDLTGWNTSNVTSMYRMFRSNDSFNQNISSWDINQVTIFNDFLYQGDGLSTANYDAILIGWDAQGAMSYSGTFNFGSSQYSCRAEAARTSLISKWGGITDGGLNTSINCNFVSTWDTRNAGSASDTIVLPMTAGPTVDWGDGTIDTTNTHTYAVVGIKTITISGVINTFRFNNSGDKAKITDVSNWGGFDIYNTNIFHGCSNLDISATDAPTVTATDLSRTFRLCTSLTNPNLSAWDVSGVLKLGNSYKQGMFASCTSLVNPDLSGWDTSSVTHMYAVFYNCNNFNSPSISDWDVSSVLYFGNNADWAMFGLCTSFNQPLNWSINTVGSVNMSNIFFGCTAFNQDISSWNVSRVTSMRAMFKSCTNFNQNLGAWNTGLVTNMTEMFQFATSFNNGGSPDIDNWDVSSVTNFGNSWNLAMFLGASSFNQPIGSWDTSSMIQAIAMFSGASSFNQPIGTWNTSNLLYAGGTSQINWGMFYNATAFDQDISAWDVNQITRFSSFMTGVTLSTANYDALLIAWDAQGTMSFSGTVNFGSSQYTSGGAAETARTSLIAKWGGIVDGGAA